MLDFQKIGILYTEPLLSNTFDVAVKIGLMYYYWPYLIIGLT